MRVSHQGKIIRFKTFTFICMVLYFLSHNYISTYGDIIFIAFLIILMSIDFVIYSREEFPLLPEAEQREIKRGLCILVLMGYLSPIIPIIGFIPLRFKRVIYICNIVIAFVLGTYFFFKAGKYDKQAEDVEIARLTEQFRKASEKGSLQCKYNFWQSLWPK